MCDIHLDSVRLYETYTDGIGNMTTLLNYSDKDLKFYCVNKEIIDTFVNKTDRYEIIDLNKNSYYNACNELYKSRLEDIFNGKIAKEYNAVPDIKTKNNDAHNESAYNFIKKICGEGKEYYYVNGRNNSFNKEKENQVLIDRNFKKMYKNDFLNDNIITYSNKFNYKNNKLILKKKINLEKTFDETYGFINFPTYRCEDKRELRYFDQVLEVIYEKIILSKSNKIEKLILISGSNEYKKYFTEKHDWITTTHYYEEVHFRQKDQNKALWGVTSKTKGKIDGYLKDILYIQNNDAPYIDYCAFIKRYAKDLEAKGVGNYFKHQNRKVWHQGFDLLARLIKHGKNIINPIE